MNIKSKVRVDLSQEDVQEALYDFLKKKNIGFEFNKKDIDIEVEEIKRRYDIGIYDYETVVIGYKVTAKLDR